MRLYGNFSGCRVLAYCIMCNHLHILLEVPPMPEGGLSDAELLKRLRAIYSVIEVAEVEMKRLIGCSDLPLSQVVRYRIRYFTDGAVLGSRGFVDEIFKACCGAPGICGWECEGRVFCLESGGFWVAAAEGLRPGRLMSEVR